MTVSSKQGLPIRVVSVIPGEESGSSMVFCRRINEVLESLGVDVHPFYLRSRTSPGRILAERSRFRRLLAEVRPGIVHAQYGTMTSFFCVISTRRPKVITFRGSDLNPTPSLNPVSVLLKSWMSQLSAASAHASICVSEELKQRLVMGRDKAVVLPSGVDTRIFRPMPIREARRKIGWNDADPVVLFYGGRHPKVKRLDLAQAAMESVRRELPQARFENMDGSLDPALIPVYMAASDCFLMTSDYEGSPTIVQESKACDLPVVSVPVGDVEDQLRGVRHCEIVQRDPALIGAALIRVLSRRERSDGSSHIGDASLDRVGARTLEIYRSVLAGESPR